MRPAPIVPAHRHGVFTAAGARAAGWSSAGLIRAAKRNELRRFAPGVFAARDDDESPTGRRAQARAAAVAATLRTEDAVVSHLSAALLAGLPTWKIPVQPCVTISGRPSGDTTCAHLHRARLPSADILAASVRRTTSARTVIDIAREHGREDAVVVGDAALRGNRTTRDELDRVLASCAHWPGIRRARQVVMLLDGLAESALESVSRLSISSLRLPAPALQPVIIDEFGFEVARVDFYWDEFGVVGEADGRDKYEIDGFDVLRNEKWRQERLEDTGLVVVRWGRTEVITPALLGRKLTTAFARGLARSPEQRRWRLH